MPDYSKHFRQHAAQAERTAEALGALWCALMHDSAMWPIHGRYQCRECGRQYHVPWESRKLAGAARTPMRSALLPVVLLLLIVQGSPLRAAEPSVGAAKATWSAEFATARAYYGDGEFKKAAAQFRRAVESDPNDAESYYWLGISYQKLADIAAPLDSKYHSRARICLTKATTLAPERLDYRRDLFDFLLDGDGSSRAELRQAAGILRRVSETDPDYLYMRRRLEQEKTVNSTMETRLSRLFLAAPRAAYRLWDLPQALHVAARH